MSARAPDVASRSGPARSGSSCSESPARKSAPLQTRSAEEARHASDSDGFTEALPAFLTIIMMPLTYSIAQGLAFGFMSYTIVKVVAGVLTALFFLHFVLG